MRKRDVTSYNLYRDAYRVHMRGLSLLPGDDFMSCSSSLYCLPHRLPDLPTVYHK